MFAVLSKAPRDGFKVGRGPVGCGSSLTGCGRLAGPRLPCPPHGEHAFIGVRQYRARPFFASASPAPLPRSLFDQHEPSVLAHPPPGEIRLVDLEPEQRQALGSTHSIRSAIPIGRGVVRRFEHAQGAGDLAVTARRKGIDSHYIPAPASSAQDYSQPNRSYSYYNQDGIEHDSRYQHWTF